MNGVDDVEGVDAAEMDVADGGGGNGQVGGVVEHQIRRGLGSGGGEGGFVGDDVVTADRKRVSC